MFSRLLIIFILVPLVELFILIKVGKFVGTGNTILIVILTGILGAAFAKSQGIGIISKIRSSLNQMKIPENELIQGLMILAGGIMLITPGFLTDLLGFSLILPFTRKFYSSLLISYLKNKIKSGHWQHYGKHDYNMKDFDNESNDDSDNKPEIMQ